MIRSGPWPLLLPGLCILALLALLGCGRTTPSATTPTSVPTTETKQVQSAREYPVRTRFGGIAQGPQGVWFTQPATHLIGRVTSQGNRALFIAPDPHSMPEGIVAGPDGNLWFADPGTNKIGRITPQGQVTEFAVPYNHAFAAPEIGGITATPDGNLWFTAHSLDAIDRITPQGQITQYALVPPHPAGLPGYFYGPGAITAMPDGALWFTATERDTVVSVTP